MSEQKQVIKPWSKKKRLKVTVAASVVVFLVALTLGSGAYLIGKALGLIETQSIKQGVMEKIEDDPELQASLEAALRKKNCENKHLGITVTYDESFSLLEERELCLGFERKEQGLSRKITFTLNTEAKETVVDRLITSLDQATSNSFNHPDGEAVEIMGSKGEVPITYVVIKTGPQKTWIAEYAPLGEGYDHPFNTIISEAQFK